MQLNGLKHFEIFTDKYWLDIYAAAKFWNLLHNVEQNTSSRLEKGDWI